jgi:hypothetical protein
VIRVAERRLAPELEGLLRGHQAQVDALATYAERVEAARLAWKKKNPERFRPIREALTEMCAGENRCMYCEDSAADEIEHVRPKSLFPDQTFVWENYLYACGPCNGPKSNSFSVIASQRRGISRPRGIIEIERKRGEPITLPEPGRMMLIDPRREDPLRFLKLDLVHPFHFHAVSSRVCLARARAVYTIHVLGLNARDTLLKRRRAAYGTYVARLKEYISERDTARRGRMAFEIVGLDHPTVWREMQRQHRAVDELRPLFEQAPEALAWRREASASTTA